MENKHKNIGYSGFGYLYFNMGRFKLSSRFFKYILDFRENLLKEDDISLAPIINNLAACVFNTGYLTKAYEYFRIALSLYELHCGCLDENYLLVKRNIDNVSNDKLTPQPNYKKQWKTYVIDDIKGVGVGGKRKKKKKKPKKKVLY